MEGLIDMKYELDQYQPRKISYSGVEKSGDWHVKVYTISNKDTFTAHNTLKRTIELLPEWLKEKEHTPLPDYKVAFLIVHEAREGVWILLNCWVGGEMIETLTYFSSKDKPEQIAPSPHTNALVCVWELEVMIHERKAWIKDVLMQASNPQFELYLNNVLSHEE